MPIDTANKEMTSIEMVKLLMTRANYKGTITNSMIRQATIIRFQTTKTEMTFEEYRKIAKARKEINEKRRKQNLQTGGGRKSANEKEAIEK